jgi:hypothetical protein
VLLIVQVPGPDYGGQIAALDARMRKLETGAPSHLEGGTAEESAAAEARNAAEERNKLAAHKVIKPYEEREILPERRHLLGIAESIEAQRRAASLLTVQDVRI